MDILCNLYGKTLLHYCTVALLHYCNVGECCVGGAVSRLCVVSGVFSNRLHITLLQTYVHNFVETTGRQTGINIAPVSINFLPEVILIDYY